MNRILLSDTEQLFFATNQDFISNRDRACDKSLLHVVFTEKLESILDIGNHDDTIFASGLDFAICDHR